MISTKIAKKAAKRAKVLLSGDKFIGSEPLPDSIKTRMDITLAYNWYNYSCDNKQLIPWIIEYMKNSGFYTQQQISTYRSISDNRTSSTVGAIARLINNGVNMPKETVEWAHKKILKTLTYALIHKNSELVQPKYTISIADRVKEKSFNIIGDLEVELDKFCANGYVSDFNPYDYMKTNDVKSIHATKLAKYYESLSKELQDALSNEDPQLKEGYSYLTKPQLRKYLEFVNKIVADAQSMNQIKKAVRKPRKPKEKSATQLISKLKYLKESSQFKIASIDPTRIIRAQTLIVFNTKYKKLGMYVSDGPAGLSIKGTTIINYDPVLSMTKTLRKPEDILPSILNNSKTLLNKTFNGIKTTAASLNGRINEDTILVRIL